MVDVVVVSIVHSSSISSVNVVNHKQVSTVDAGYLWIHAATMIYDLGLQYLIISKKRHNLGTMIWACWWWCRLPPLVEFGYAAAIVWQPYTSPVQN